jgi:hypothetical protein
MDGTSGLIVKVAFHGSGVSTTNAACTYRARVAGIVSDPKVATTIESQQVRFTRYE